MQSSFRKSVVKQGGCQKIPFLRIPMHLLNAISLVKASSKVERIIKTLFSLCLQEKSKPFNVTVQTHHSHRNGPKVKIVERIGPFSKRIAFIMNEDASNMTKLNLVKKHEEIIFFRKKVVKWLLISILLPSTMFTVCSCSQNIMVIKLGIYTYIRLNHVSLWAFENFIHKRVGR